MIRLFFVGAFLISLACYAQPEDLARNMAMAETQANLGNYTQSLVTLEDILVTRPNHLPAQELKLLILIKLDREKEALKDIEQYLSMYSGQPEYIYLRGVFNLKKEKYSKAVEDFNKAIQIGMPGESVHKAFLNRGMAFFHNADFELAEADFDEVIALDSRNATAYHGKGMVKYELHEYENAIIEFQKALKFDPDNAIVHYNLAMSYFRMDDDENACYHFNKSCSLGHRNACRLLLMECDINISE
ncbi:MAG: tetratricopeptide repeat protein [Bacteroidales bacterium]|nr:tetratricopeptide repeat protein [Bacteroidales bacterium]